MIEFKGYLIEHNTWFNGWIVRNGPKVITNTPTDKETYLRRVSPVFETLDKAKAYVTDNLGGF